MKKNKYAQKLITIDSEIDLHGMTDYEAEDAVLGFLTSARESNHHVVKIITGKGNLSIGEPVAKNITRKILLQKDLKFTTAKVQEGGSGALIVNLD